ncbi:hypothetical protein GGX14DRAFT_565199 [Mycena pura]|uniref:Helicase ATP-binding domain-containing protein n=1 Tax=Mycena pura TaxID=153505 RepID=A0AAD6YFZ6_9AGAR|nr:hypothetical protein GGX14DRAFT_565199 [Mycena pura]
MDEAHCIGGPDFRPAYRRFGRARYYTGMDVPYIACTATCHDATLVDITLREPPFLGHRRQSSLPHAHPTKPRQPGARRAQHVSKNACQQYAEDTIPKCLFYFNSLRVPWRGHHPQDTHLRNCVYPFSSINTEKSKARCWAGLADGLSAP